MPDFNYERAAMILAEAAFHGDGPTAQRHGITARTIRNYRTRLQHDPQLAAFYQQKKRELGDGWTLTVNRALDAIADYTLQCAQEFKRTPENLYALAGAAKILADATLTKDALNARHAEPYRPTSQADGTVVSFRADQRRSG